jgi:outer membrane protein TolC
VTSFALVLSLFIPMNAQAFFGNKPTPKPKPAVLTEPLTLSKAYELALKRSEELGMKSEMIEAAKAHFYQAFAGILPRVSYHADHFRQDSDENASSQDGSTRNFTRETSDEGYFSLSQSLFGGFKDFAAIGAAGSEKAQRRYELERARQVLFQNVMEAFYGVLQAQKDREIFEKTQKLHEDRIGELKGRVKLGRSRESEMLTSTVDLKLAAADVEESKRVEVIW